MFLTFWRLLALVVISITSLLVILYICKVKFMQNNSGLIWILLLVCIVCVGILITNEVEIAKKETYLEQQRQHIEYQISIMDEKTNKTKLNEWILSYNDTINEIKIKNEVFGFFNWYYGIDIDKFNYIEIV